MEEAMASLEYGSPQRWRRTRLARISIVLLGLIIVWFGTRAIARKRCIKALDDLTSTTLNFSREERHVAAERSMWCLRRIEEWSYGKNQRTKTEEAITAPDVTRALELSEMVEKLWTDPSFKDIGHTDQAGLMAKGDTDWASPDGIGARQAEKIRQLLMSCAIHLGDVGDSDTAFRLCGTMFALSQLYSGVELEAGDINLYWLHVGDSFLSDGWNLLQVLAASGSRVSSDRLVWLADIIGRVRNEPVLVDCMPAHCKKVVHNAHKYPYCIAALAGQDAAWDQEWHIILAGIFFSSAMVDLEGRKLAVSMPRWLLSLRDEPCWPTVLERMDEEMSHRPLRWRLYNSTLERLRLEAQKHCRWNERELLVAEGALRLIASLQKQGEDRPVLRVFELIVSDLPTSRTTEGSVQCELLRNPRTIQGRGVTQGFRVYLPPGEGPCFVPFDVELVVAWPGAVDEDVGLPPSDQPPGRTESPRSFGTAMMGFRG